MRIKNDDGYCLTYRKSEYLVISSCYYYARMYSQKLVCWQTCPDSEAIFYMHTHTHVSATLKVIKIQ